MQNVTWRSCFWRSCFWRSCFWRSCIKGKGCLAVLSLVLFVGCTMGLDRPQASPTKLEPKVFFERAGQLSQMGDYLGASQYYEALLAMGGQEEIVLPMLIEAEVLSGRLLAALESAKRLAVLWPKDKQLQALVVVLENATHSRLVNMEEEVMK